MPQSEQDEAFVVVGIGASAGGLEAISALLDGVDFDHMGFVIIQHRSVQHESALVEILSRATRMKVETVTDGMTVEKNHFYVAPAGAQVAILRGKLHLVQTTSRLPIDFFFRSLAEDRGPRAVGIILSGMGSDGTFGLKAIKEHGGICLVQAPETAQFDSMPRSAIEAGVVDSALAPSAIGPALAEMAKHPFLVAPSGHRPQPAGMQKLYVLLRDAFGHDFTDYKQTTIERRIERRMAVQRVDRLDDYLRLVHAQPDELKKLYQDLLINVTCFFRDPGAFEAIERAVIPRLVARRAPRDPLRVWVPACASGEEAYSIAICLLEALGANAAGVPVNIFATDIDADAIERARHGVYPLNIEQDVPTERLERFFSKEENGYRISRRVRDLVVFSVQDITKDAPLSRMDLVTCRNMLIYMQAPLQQRVLATLHYALKPDSFLLLGTSETIGDALDLFAIADRKVKLYTKKSMATGLHLTRGMIVPSSTPVTRTHVERRPLITAQQLADRRLLDKYAPASVLVNNDLDILLFRGDTGPYVSPAIGQATLNLMRLVRQELHIDVWQALEQARKTGIAARKPAIVLETTVGDQVLSRKVAVEVAPLVLPEGQGTCWLVLFHDIPSATTITPGDAATADSAHLDHDGHTRTIEQELVATKEFLQTAVEELESSNEELKSTNEELQSSNEELQSTNEELETSKEELQSSNEELSTVNDELQHRIVDLTRRDNDLLNLLRSVRDPLVVVDAEGRLRRFTDAAAELFRLVSDDAGRSVAYLRPMLGGLDIERMIARAIERVEPITEDAVAVNGRWYAVTTRPYATARGAIDGALMVLIDIDDKKRSSQAAVDIGHYADKLLPAILHPLVMLDDQQRVLWANAAFFSTFAVSPADTIGNLFHNLGSGQWAHPRLRQRITSTLTDGKSFDDFLVEHEFESVGKRTKKVSGSLVRGLDDDAKVVLVSIVDTSATPEREVSVA